MKQRTVDIEGPGPDEILALDDTELAQLIFHDEPIVFRAGSACVPGRFAARDGLLSVELAQIDGGGEGVLTTLWSLASRYAAERGMAELEWVVHAVNCAEPNLRLRRMLERLGFEVTDLPGTGIVYYRRFRATESYRSGVRQGPGLSTPPR